MAGKSRFMPILSPGIIKLYNAAMASELDAEARQLRRQWLLKIGLGILLSIGLVMTLLWGGLLWIRAHLEGDHQIASFKMGQDRELRLLADNWTDVYMG